MKSLKNDSTPQMKTLSECMNKAVKNGYTENFKVTGKGLIAEDEKIWFTPDDVAIVDFDRFEGYSDPQDNAILYLIQTKDGVKGTVVDSYGAYADAKISNFVKQVQDIQMKAPEEKKWWLKLIKSL